MNSIQIVIEWNVLKPEMGLLFLLNIIKIIYCVIIDFAANVALH